MYASESTSTFIKQRHLLAYGRDDEKFTKKYGKRKAFHLGSNSSCRQHIRGHYALYKERCAEQQLKEHHHAVPRDIARARLETKKQEKAGQLTLDGVYKKEAVKVFSREEVLKAVAEFVVCDDQVITISYSGILAIY